MGWILKVVEVTCDACEKRSDATPEGELPGGWISLEQNEEGEDSAFPLVACSPSCKADLEAVKAAKAPN